MSWLHRIFLAELVAGTDVPHTIHTIREGIRIRGFQTWIMLASAILASIGLDISSPAVIIGAMLISPLMNPILGIGLGLGINDRGLLLDALRNFGLAVVASLGAAWLYFELTPLGDITTELSARTRPTLLDAGVAFVGGVAGVLATSRKGLTNAIPGVAIATALMPPLCTAGYGLAVGRWDFFLGAWYLFFLNAVLISVATYLMVQVLGFPHEVEQDDKRRLRTRLWVSAMVVVVLLPSGYILFRLLQENRARRQAENFVTNWVTQTKRQVLQQQLTLDDDRALMRVYFVGPALPPDSVSLLTAKLRAVTGREDMQLNAVQLDVDPLESKRLRDEITFDIIRRLQVPPGIVAADSARRKTAQQLERDSSMVRQVRREVRVLFPQVDQFDLGHLANPEGGRTQPWKGIAIVVWPRSNQAELARLQAFLRLRLQDSTLQVVSQPALPRPRGQ